MAWVSRSSLAGSDDPASWSPSGIVPGIRARPFGGEGIVSGRLGIGGQLVTPPKRRLGRTGLDITVVGLGTWAMGGAGWDFSWGSQDDAASAAAVQHAVSLGVNWIDTAAVYGHGHSEEVIRMALAGIPASERPLVFTKCGERWSEEDRWAPAHLDLRPVSIREECEASLRRLGVETIDLYQFHQIDTATGTPIEESWGELARLVEEGKVRHMGVSNFTVDLLERCERIRHVDTLQPRLSAIRREAASDVIPWCAAHGTGVIVWGPMRAGLLTDSFSVQRVESMDSEDWRLRAPDFQGSGLTRNIALRDALRPIAERHAATVAAVAIAWTLAWPGVTGAIVGARRPGQVDGWIHAGSVALSADDLAEIAAAIDSTGAGGGPAQP
jgi:aryl-alcohol dehydrogenase-like predicted oxidoreductase